MYISYAKFIRDAETLVGKIDKDYSNIYAIPRGGVPLGIILADGLSIPLLDKPEDITLETLIVDDLIDGGKTLSKYADNDTAVLYCKPHSPVTSYSVEQIDGWVEFPYEETEKDNEQIIVRLLEALEQDPTRDGLIDTPKRVLKFYKEFLNPPEFKFTVFDGESYDEMIVQKDIPFFSLCEHHMAPFFGTATVAYIPSGKIVGLSKLARCVEHYARRLQNQERITTQIAERINEELHPVGVAVILTARHFCMEMRGVKTHDVSTTTSKLMGAFKNEGEARAELMAIVKG